jgi:23S rRNA G2069 N7-methylase RlmK/C1962 C5-methylase RlmI
VAASNLGAVSRKEFQGWLGDGARRAGVRLQVIHEGTQPPDYPAAVHFPEARYLKFVVAVVRSA